MLLSAVSFAKSKSKTILVKMVSQAGTGFSFNTKRSRLREKLSLLHYDPIVLLGVIGGSILPIDDLNEQKSPLRGTEKNTLPLNNGLKMNLIYK